MIIKDIAENTPLKKWSGRSTMNSILKMPIETPENRFNLLLELVSYRGSLDFKRWNYKIPKIPLTKVQSEMMVAASYVHDKILVSNMIKNIAEYLSVEFESYNHTIDFKKISDYIEDEEEFSFLVKEWKLDEAFIPYSLKQSDGTEILIAEKNFLSKQKHPLLKELLMSIEIKEEEVPLLDKLNSQTEDKISMANKWIIIEVLNEFGKTGSVAGSDKLKELNKWEKQES